jgi:hypothetical protein
MNPIISIITPVGARHHQYVREAVGSALWQTVSQWEMILVNDAVQDLPTFIDQRVRLVDSPNRFIEVGKQNGNRASMARNVGLHHAQGDYVAFLDADDYLLPQALEIFLRGQLTHNRTYTFSSHANANVHLRPPEYDQQRYAEFNLHPITALVPRQSALAVGGFDEQAPGWEDWTFWLRMAIAGYCGEYYRGPVFVYRDQYSINHFEDVAKGQKLMDDVIRPYKDDRGVIRMAQCCGGVSRTSARRVVAQIGDAPVSDGYTTIEYTGSMLGTFKLIHPVTKHEYRVGRNHTHRYIRVPPEDMAFFQSRPDEFRVVMPVSDIVPPPPPAPVVEMSVSVVDDSIEEVLEQTTEEIVVESSKRGRKRAQT